MKAGTTEAAKKRRNAVGNANALPVLRRLVLAALVSVTSQCTQHPWDSHLLPRPYHTDCAWDVFEEAAEFATLSRDLVEECEIFAGWPRHALVGPDPSALGRTNRAHRKAALGNQIGTILGKNAIEPLVPWMPRWRLTSSAP